MCACVWAHTLSLCICFTTTPCRRASLRAAAACLTHTLTRAQQSCTYSYVVGTGATRQRAHAHTQHHIPHFALAAHIATACACRSCALSAATASARLLYRFFRIVRGGVCVCAGGWVFVFACVRPCDANGANRRIVLSAVCVRRASNAPAWDIIWDVSESRTASEFVCTLSGE